MNPNNILSYSNQFLNKKSIIYIQIIVINILINSHKLYFTLKGVVMNIMLMITTLKVDKKMLKLCIT